MTEVDERGGHSDFVGVPHASGSNFRRSNLTSQYHGHEHGIAFELAGV